jgi:hypothetical protein
VRRSCSWRGRCGRSRFPNAVDIMDSILKIFVPGFFF